MITKLYQNNRNPKKYIEVRRYADGHYVWKQFMLYFQGNVFFECRFYTGCSLKKYREGVWHRMRKSFIMEVLNDDYTLVKEA